MSVKPFQLMQWKHWLRIEIRAGRTCRHSSGRSVKAHAARCLGLNPRERRETVLAHVEAALDACTAAGVPLTATAEITPDTNPSNGRSSHAT